GHGRVLTGRKLLVGHKLITVHGQAQVIIAPDKILVVHGHGTTTVVIVKLNMVGEIAVIMLYLLTVVLDLAFGAPPGPLALDGKEFPIIDQLAIDPGFYVLKEIDLIGLGAKLRTNYFRT